MCDQCLSQSAGRVNFSFCKHLICLLSHVIRANFSFFICFIYILGFQLAPNVPDSLLFLKVQLRLDLRTTLIELFRKRNVQQVFLFAFPQWSYVVVSARETGWRHRYQLQNWVVVVSVAITLVWSGPTLTRWNWSEVSNALDLTFHRTQLKMFSIEWVFCTGIYRIISYGLQRSIVTLRTKVWPKQVCMYTLWEESTRNSQFPFRDRLALDPHTRKDHVSTHTTSSVRRRPPTGNRKRWVW